MLACVHLYRVYNMCACKCKLYMTAQVQTSLSHGTHVVCRAAVSPALLALFWSRESPVSGEEVLWASGGEGALFVQWPW